MRYHTLILAAALTAAAAAEAAGSTPPEQAVLQYSDTAVTIEGFMDDEIAESASSPVREYVEHRTHATHSEVRGDAAEEIEPQPLTDEALHETVALHFELCQLMRYMNAWFYNFPVRNSPADFAERESVDKYVYPLMTELRDRKARFRITDMHILAAGLKSSNGEDFRDQCWPHWSRQAENLLLTPDYAYLMYGGIGSGLQRRIDTVSADVKFLKPSKPWEQHPRDAGKDVVQDEEHTRLSGDGDPKLQRLGTKLQALEDAKAALDSLKDLGVRSFYVRAALDRLIKVTTFPGDTVEDLKTDVQFRHDISPDDQLLVFDNTELMEERLVSDYNIPEEGVVHLIKRMPRDLYGEGSGAGDNIVSAANGGNDNPDRPALEKLSYYDFDRWTDSYLTVPYRYGHFLQPEQLLLNFSIGVEAGTVLFNGVSLDDPSAETSAYIVPTRERTPETLSELRSMDRYRYYQQAKITRWTKVAAATDGPPVDPRKDGKMVKYIVNILEVNGEPVHMPNIALQFDTSSQRTYVDISASWTYHDLPDFEFPADVSMWD